MPGRAQVPLARYAIRVATDCVPTLPRLVATNQLGNQNDLNLGVAGVSTEYNVFVAPARQRGIHLTLSGQPYASGNAAMARMRRKHRRSREKLSNDLLALYDRLSEFSDQCAFLCDAFAAIPIHEEAIDPATARGIGLSAQWMRRRVQEITLDLKRIRERAGGAARE